MLSVNYFEILSKPQYTCTENKYLCVLLNGCVVLKFAPVAAVSTSGFCPDLVPKRHLCGDFQYALNMGPCLQFPLHFQHHVYPLGQCDHYDSTFLQYFSYVITIGVLILVDSDSLGDSSLTHGKVLGVWVAEEESHILKLDMLTWFQIKVQPGFLQCFQFLLSLKGERCQDKM